MYALGRIEEPFSYYKPPRKGGAHVFQIDYESKYNLKWINNIYNYRYGCNMQLFYFFL